MRSLVLASIVVAAGIALGCGDEVLQSASSAGVGARGGAGAAAAGGAGSGGAAGSPTGAGGSTPACAPWWADCDGDPSNGCETDLDQDYYNCGSCGQSCDDPGGVNLGGKLTCAAGKCWPCCGYGFWDCSTDPLFCECYWYGNETDFCAGCAYPAGYADCDGAWQNGCETDTSSDPANCGSCWLACAPAQSCAGGVCK